MGAEVDFLTLLGNYAFPIVCCIGLFWKINMDEKSRADERAEERKERREEAEKFSTAINNNTLVMQRLVDRLGEEVSNGKH